MIVAETWASLPGFTEKHAGLRPADPRQPNPLPWPLRPTPVQYRDGYHAAQSRCLLYEEPCFLYCELLVNLFRQTEIIRADMGPEAGGRESVPARWPNRAARVPCCLGESLHRQGKGDCGTRSTAPVFPRRTGPFIIGQLRGEDRKRSYLQ